MKKIVPVVILAALLLSGCRHAPIYEVSGRPMPLTARSMTLDQMEQTIVEAGQVRNWKFQRLAPGKLRATQELPKYSADVDILFDQNSYSIRYVSSRGMDEKNGVIHQHYNQWVHFLEADIDARLNNAALRR